ncbi:histidine--tRNA ligase [Marinicrinis lubricantis]|uniref:Histidine--tRNA ligase n=1 Tax=Marinicrinis lubricantis TaxID=2086470 RepID=A0ABW1IVS4_9BACL
MSIQKPKGTQDFLPGIVEQWQRFEQKAREICARFHYKEIRTPVFESTELFLRGVGETTDVVSKEMYTFEDKGKRSMTLRPEGTAGVVRAYVENKLYGEPDISKLFYIGPMFRYEQPQAGRYRQFHQFGIEAFGSDDPALDAEVIAMGYEIYRELGLSNVRVEINSVGNPESRAVYRDKLLGFLEPLKDQLCKDCLARMDKNPMRVLDCKVDQHLFEDAPSILDSLDEECTNHFEAVQDHLTRLDIPFILNPKLVRGLDYYTHTAFEFKSEGIGSIDTIGGGGRYNGLVSQLGGPEQPGIGFGIGIERVLLVMQNQGIVLDPPNPLDVYLISMGEQAEKEAVKLLYQLRAAGIRADKDYTSRKMKAQLKSADRFGARFAAILGEDELAKGEIVLKDLGTGDQQSVSLNDWINQLKEKCERGV